MSRIVESMQPHRRSCFVCGSSIETANNSQEFREQVKKASTVSVGAGLERVAHDACLKALQQEYDLYEARQDAELMSDFAGRQAQIGSNSVGRGTTGTGGEGGVGANHLLNRPCFYCQGQVTRGAIMTIGAFRVAAHPACKAKVTEMIAAALDIDHLSEDRQGSIVGMAER